MEINPGRDEVLRIRAAYSVSSKGAEDLDGDARRQGREVSTEAETILLLKSAERELIRWFRDGGFSVNLEVRVSCPENPRMCAGTVLTSPPESIVEALRTAIRESVDQNVPEL